MAHSARQRGELRESGAGPSTGQRRYQALYDSLDEGFCVIEVLFDARNRPVDYLFLEANAQFEGHTGLVDAVGRTIRSMVPNHDQHWFDTYGRIALTGEAARFENEAVALGRFYDVYAFRVDEPEQHHVAVLFRDISERKRVDGALRKSQERQAFLLELSDVLRPLTDAGELEAAATRLLGQHLGANRVYYADIDNQGDAAVIHPDYTDGLPSMAGRHRFSTFDSHARGRWLAGRITTTIDTRVDESLSAEQHAALAASRVRASLGIPLVKAGELVAALAVDQSEPRTWSEDEIELARETAERTWAAIERGKAEGALREADRRKDEFLAMLSHELRNPLAPMRSAVSLLEARLDKGEDPSRAIDIITHQADRLARLVDDLLDVARINRGTIELRKEPVDLVRLVSRAIESVWDTAREKAQELATTLPDTEVTVIGDGVRLEQVVANLLSNATKYTQVGGRIDVVLDTRENFAEVRVTDSGIGIDPAFIGEVFDLFRQADTSLDRSEGGLGIGLTLTRRLVELHAGSVTARSEGIGEGSEFVVRLPLTVGAATAAVEAKAPRAKVAHAAHDSPEHRRVLVVDDNMDHAEVMSELIADLGHDVHVAHNGQDAIARARELIPDVVLLDIGLPGLSGYEVAERLRSDSPDGRLTIIALTGYGQPEDRVKSGRAGFDWHLVKPVDLGELEKLLSGVDGED